MSVLIVAGALKVTVLLVGALITAIFALKTRSAALRHWVLATAVACAWLMLPLSVVSPSWLNTPLWRVATQPAAGRAVLTTQSSSAQAAPPQKDAAIQAQFAAALHPTRSNGSAGRLASVIWASGSLISVFTLSVGLGRLRWLASHARIIDSGPWCELGEQLRRAHRLSSPIHLLQSDHPSLLITWGWRRPKILLPAAACTWPRERIQIVLAHEIAHIARGDWIVQLAAEALRAVYWINPLLWIACRRLRAESEGACDDAVLACGIEAPAYATHLLALARNLHAHRQPWLPAPAMARPSSLEGRIRAMLNNTLNRRPVSGKARAATAGLLLAVTVFVAGVRGQAQFYSVAGTVLDPTNRVLAGAKLVLTNTTSEAKYEVKSDATGRYEFVGVPPSMYTMEASVPGFATLKNELSVAGNMQRDLHLRVGSLEETITVRDASAPLIPPDAATILKRQEAQHRYAEIVDREKTRCAAGGAATSIGGRILPPAKLLDVRPVYPDHLKAAKIGGIVTMDATISTEGIVRDIQNLKGPQPDLEAAAADAVRQWQFSATLLNCEPIEVSMKVTVTFSAVR